MPRHDFRMEDDSAVEQMRRDTNRKNQAQVVRDALSYYQLMLQMTKDGKKIFVGVTRDSATEITVKQWKDVVTKAKP